MTERAPGEGLYRVLLRLYPREFRDACADAMLEFYRQRWHERSRSRVRFWLRVYADGLTNAVAERAATWRSFTRQPRPRRTSMLIQDLRYAARTLQRSPGFTLVVLVTLAVGIGANVAIFSVVNGVLLRPLPFAEPERVIQLANGEFPSTVSEPEFVDLWRGARSFSALGAYAYADGNVTGGDVAERVRLARIDAGFFRALSPAPLLGRTIAPDDDVIGAPDVVVLSYALWQSQFGSDSAAVGKQIVLNDVPRTVIGVMRRHFDFPSPTVAVWTPLRLNPDSLWERRNHYLRVVGRLAPQATVTSAHAEVERFRAAWARDYPETYNPEDPLRVAVVPMRDRVLGGTRPYLLALLGAVGFVLLIACVNVASLLLARGERRWQEIQIRAALGAGRRRIAVQLLTENALLTLAGGAAGVALAWPLQRVVVAAAPASIPRLGEVRIDTGVLLFAAAVCLLTGLLFSLAPVLRVMAADALAALSHANRGSATPAGRTARRTRSALVVGEIALAVVMLAGATLFLRTLLDLQRTDLGFRTANILTLRLTIPRAAGASAKAVRLLNDLVARVEGMPGVEQAAAMAWTPMLESGGNWSLVADGVVNTSNATHAPLASPQQVTPRFFETIGIPLRRGRTFEPTDDGFAPLVAIVNETFARALWGVTDPIGRRIRMDSEGSPWATVVGVVGDTRVDGLTEPAPPIMYFPHAQAGQSAYFTALSMTLLVKSTAAPAALVPPIRRAVVELDANIPISEIRTLDDVVGSTIASHRFITMLLTAFATLALALAAIGIYGVMAYGVAQRRYELGVRMALGARRGTVLRLVLAEGLALTATGLVLGVAGAFAISRVLRTMLANVGAIDHSAVGVVSLCLLAVAVVAVALPARAAMRVSPTEALRSG